MILYNLNGKLIKRNYSNYLIDWNKPSRSKIQFKVKQFLKPYWNSMIIFEEFPVSSTLLKVDILNATLKIAIEVNGNQHITFNKHFHQHPINFLKSIKNDVKKAKWLELNNFKLIEIFEDEIDYISKKYFATKHNLIL